MSVKQMSKVFEHSKSTGVARLVLLALADVASDDGEVTAYARSQKILAAKANCKIDTVRRSVIALRELGEIEVISTGEGRMSSNYRLHLDEIPPDQPPRQEGADPPREGDSPPEMSPQPPRQEGAISPSLSVSLPPLPSRAAEAAPKKAEVRALVQRVWERSDPRPATPFVAALQIAKSLIAAGHEPSAVEESMMQAPTISVRCCEIVLNQGRREKGTLTDRNRAALATGVSAMREPGYTSMEERYLALGPQIPLSSSQGVLQLPKEAI